MYLRLIEKSVRESGRLAAAVGLFAVMLGALPVTSQILPGTGSEPEVSVSASVTTPAELASPRATFMTFMSAFPEGEDQDLGLAAACLDLSRLPLGVGDSRRHQVAQLLKKVIDRTRGIDASRLPNEPDGSPYVHLRQVGGEVVIARVADGRWLFSANTVRGVEDLWLALAGNDANAGAVQAGPVTPSDWLRGVVPQSLRLRFLTLEWWQWFGLVFVIVGGVLADRLFLFMVRGVVLRLLRRRLEKIDQTLLAAALKPAGVLVMVLVWWVGIGVLGLPVRVLEVYGEAVWMVLILAAVVTAYRFTSVVAEALQRMAEATVSRADDLLVPLLRKAVKCLIVAVGIVLMAEAMDQNLTGILAGLGLGGLAFALAAQDTVSNLFGSLTVLLDRPFHVGDWVVIGNVEGTVEEVGFRSTRIRTFYNSLITLPNSNLTNAAVDNLGVREYRRWSTRLGLAYNTPPEKVDAFCEGLRELVARHPHTRKDYFLIYLNEFGASALEVMVYVFFVTPDWGAELRERHNLAVDILRLAHDQGIEFAFPTQTLYLRDEEWQNPELAGQRFAASSVDLCAQARSTARDLTAVRNSDESSAPGINQPEDQV